MRKAWRNGVLLAALGILGYAVGIWLGALYSPRYAVRVRVDREQAFQKAREVATSWLNPDRDYETRTDLFCDRRMLANLERHLGARAAMRLVREGFPVFRWRVRWISGRVTERFRSDVPDEAALEAFRSTLLGDVMVEIGPDGNLVSFTRRFAPRDTTHAPVADSLDARKRALDFLTRYVGFRSENLDGVEINRVRRESRRSGAFIVTVPGESRSDWPQCSHVLTVARNGVVSYRREYAVPELAELPAFSSGNVFELIGLIGLGALGLWYFIRRLRADQLDLGQAIPLAAAVALCASVVSLVQMKTSGFYTVVALVFILPAMGILTAVLFSLSDSLGNDVWPEKVRPLNGFARGIFFSKPVGNDLLRAFAWAGIALGLVHLFDALLLSSRAAVMVEDAYQLAFSESVGVVIVLCGVTSAAVIRELALRAFAMSYLRRFVQGFGLLIFMGFFVGLFDFVGIGLGQLEPQHWATVRSGIFGAVMTAGLLQGSLLVPVAAGWFTMLVDRGASYLLAGYTGSGLVVLAIVALVLGIAAISAISGGTEETLRALEPSYLRRLAERERLRRELEIARHVQQTFLPATVPRVPSLDIASRCAPATEVGGDYYDLIRLDDDRLGVIIGDVSGKGIGAAFYMTLTKGFLHAYLRQLESPREVLSRVNQLFYENAERGRFISMIYGVFDLRRRELVFARAGHNPLLLRRSETGEVRAISPTGMALGLAGSNLFARVTEEQRLPFQSGDIFVFYTDGFTEAMTLEDVEFGEQRFAEALREVKPDWSAEQILDFLFTSVERFVGKGKQHDDMTLVVVKVR